MAGRRARERGEAQPDLFSVDPSSHTVHRMDTLLWPEQERGPVNRASARVRSQVWADLIGSPDPLIVAGYSAIAQLVDFVSAWRTSHRRGTTRVLLGAEPFPTTRRSFGSAQAVFTEEVRRYWLEERSVSLRLSAKIIQAIEAAKDGRIRARFIHGEALLHAKIYLGVDAATVGSSNFTDAGLSHQLEANARFTQNDEPERYAELATVANNLWQLGQPWDTELLALLESLLKVVGWRDALARACADLLEGEWAERYLGGSGRATTLWPSQRAGIAQALWVTKSVGSVLVADATGSGKTRMGAHLVRAMRDRLWSTGAARRDLSVLVCPPAVQSVWRREAIDCGVDLFTASHGLLSRVSSTGPSDEELAVSRAQILAVDEAHNFLNPDANRTQQVRDSQADHVLLFTATPINRGAGDLLQLVALLGADNFADETLAVLNRLYRRRHGDQVVSASELDLLRREIQRFTVRRTKIQLNELVEREPDAYLHPDTGRVCRYPRHDARTYPTGETAADETAATQIRTIARTLRGVVQLEPVVAVPPALRSEYTDERWLQFRLTSTRGLAAHHVLGAMRSSRAALVEHLRGTTAAVEQFEVPVNFKSTATGNVIGALEERARQGPPVIELNCELPDFLKDPQAWQQVCLEERDRYRQIAEATLGLSNAREQAKAALLEQLAGGHERVLAFDHHLITLSVIAMLLRCDPEVEVLVATGSNQKRGSVQRAFAPASTRRAIALCSDALNEGLNLQGASAIVHLDLPTTLRVAEQRVGRVDRMDSPYDAIEAWWPADGEAFATRANELLVRRSEESAQLLGSNLSVPDLRGETAERLVTVAEQIAQTETVDVASWDGIRDALAPVRGLVTGDDALVPPEVYAEHRHSTHRVLARVSPVRATRPWAFLSVTAGSDGAPKWLLIEGPTAAAVGDLNDIVTGLRRHLDGDPPTRPLDDAALQWLERVLDAAAAAEHHLLPQRMRRALEQMHLVLTAWARAARQAGDEAVATRWQHLARLANTSPASVAVDPYVVAERWIAFVSPVLESERNQNRRRPYILLRDITKRLTSEPGAVANVEEAFAGLPLESPLADRVSACILGVVDSSAPGDPTPLSVARRGSR